MVLKIPHGLLFIPELRSVQNNMAIHFVNDQILFVDGAIAMGDDPCCCAGGPVCMAYSYWYYDTYGYYWVEAIPFNLESFCVDPVTGGRPPAGWVLTHNEWGGCYATYYVYGSSCEDCESWFNSLTPPGSPPYASCE